MQEGKTPRGAHCGQRQTDSGPHACHYYSCYAPARSAASWACQAPKHEKQVPARLPVPALGVCQSGSSRNAWKLLLCSSSLAPGAGATTCLAACLRVSQCARIGCSCRLQPHRTCTGLVRPVPVPALATMLEDAAGKRAQRAPAVAEEPRSRRRREAKALGAPGGAVPLGATACLASTATRPLAPRARPRRDLLGGAAPPCRAQPPAAAAAAPLSALRGRSPHSQSRPFQSPRR